MTRLRPTTTTTLRGKEIALPFFSSCSLKSLLYIYWQHVLCYKVDFSRFNPFCVPTAFTIYDKYQPTTTTRDETYSINKVFRLLHATAKSFLPQQLCVTTYVCVCANADIQHSRTLCGHCLMCRGSLQNHPSSPFGSHLFAW
jgi:hypothetical protein